MNFQNEIEKMIVRNRDVALKATRIPVCMDDESAEKVGKGFDEILRMKNDEIEKLKKESFEDIVKYHSSANVKASVYHLGEALGIIHDALLGTLGKSENQMRMIKKMYHSESGKNNNVLVVNSGMQTADMANVDMNWSVAFTAQDATNAEFMKIYDFVSATKFLEYKDETSDIEAMGLGAGTSDVIKPRFFATAFKYGERDFRFSAWRINDILSNIRLSALKNISLAAYRCLGDTAGAEIYSASTKFTPTGSDELKDEILEVLKARQTLNDVHFKMVERANPSVDPKSKNPKSEAALDSVTVNSPILFYYNHQHRGFINKLRSMTGGDNGINIDILDEWVFIPSALMPKSGGHTITGENGDVRDAHGFYGKIKENGPISQLAGKAVIPGLRNQYGIFRNLSFVNKSDTLKETTTIGAKQSHKFIMDDRQHALVKLK